MYTLVGIKFANIYYYCILHIMTNWDSVREHRTAAEEDQSHFQELATRASRRTRQLLKATAVVLAATVAEAKFHVPVDAIYATGLGGIATAAYGVERNFAAPRYEFSADMNGYLLAQLPAIPDSFPGAIEQVDPN